MTENIPEPKLAHYVKKTDVLEGYVNGKEAEALCGKRFVPSDSPDKYAVCTVCVTIMDVLTKLVNSNNPVVILKPVTNDELINKYKYVIADLEQDIGYEGNAQEVALSVLRGRLHELETVWSIPDEQWEDPESND